MILRVMANEIKKAQILKSKQEEILKKNLEFKKNCFEL
jgi:hypothetical protein